MNFLLFLVLLTGGGLVLVAMATSSLVIGFAGCALMLLAAYLLDKRGVSFGDNHLPWD